MGGFPTLFSPFLIGPCVLKNRLVALPVFTGYAHPDGKVSALMIEHYTRLADSGVAMVVVANAAVTSDGIISAHNLRVDRDEFIPGLTKLVAAIKRRGAIACLQLNHAGRFAKTDKPLLPSPMDGSNLAFNVNSLKNFMNFFPLEKRFNLTRYFFKQLSTWRRAMTAEDRDRIMLAFGDAAVRASEAGFDMIELHGANGYLLCQFLSSFTNKGQSGTETDFESRAAFPLAVFREVKRRISINFPIGFRLLLREWVPEGIDLPEALRWAKMLENEGIAYLSATAGTYNSMFSPDTIKIMIRPGYLRTDVKKLTDSVNVPTIISGRIIKPSLAEKLLKNGVADLVGLGRPIRVDIDWVNKAAAENEKEIQKCIYCNWCLKGVVLGLGLNCQRWSKLVQERTDLERKLLIRMYKGLWVLADRRDLSLLKASLPALLPVRHNTPIAIEPTVLFLQRDEYGAFSKNVRDDFLDWSRNILRRFGYDDGKLSFSFKVVDEAFDKQVHEEIERGHHGVILLGHNRQQAWRERVLYKERGKVVALIGSNERQNEVMVPVDLSSTTLLILRFIYQTFVGKSGCNLHFVHFCNGQAREAGRRWEELKKIVGWDEDFRLELIRSKKDVVAQILSRIKERKCGTIVMGKRGLTGMKRRLLGSVSAGVLRGLTDETIFLID
jgi:2,4-dienoyl-CoA reductase-like NADH-dependent reductase (Old Yellow Enzyme family)